MEQTTINNKFLIALSQFSKFGPASLRKIKNFFSDWEAGFNADKTDLVRAGLNEKTAEEFVIFRSAINPDALLADMDKEGVQALSLADPEYPALLREIYDPPALLYYRGHWPAPERHGLAVVGTRKFTPYGRQATEQLAGDLARCGFVIVSGLALGIDAIAHEAALRAGTATLAVLGSGLSRSAIYPSANRYLADRIAAEGGAVISEFPLRAEPLRHHFPQRNRVIAGLCLATLVIEAGEKSGALITARQALEQNRDVFAVPGPIFSPASIGPNMLIKQGGMPVTSAQDIITALELKQITAYIDNKKIMPQTAEEKILLPLLSYEPVHIDDLTRQSGLAAAIVAATLMVMEMKGLAKNCGGLKFVAGR